MKFKNQQLNLQGKKREKITNIKNETVFMLFLVNVQDGMHFEDHKGFGVKSKCTAMKSYKYV